MQLASPTLTTVAQPASTPTAVFGPEMHGLYLCHTPIDMRPGFDGVLARVIHWFGCVCPHCADAFINARGNRIKLFIHDGLGLWLAQRRLPQRALCLDRATLGHTVSEHQRGAVVRSHPRPALGAYRAGHPDPLMPSNLPSI